MKQTEGPVNDALSLRLSVVIPVYNEAGNVLPLLAEVRRVMADLGPGEVIFVDDGSDDAIRATLAPHLDRVGSGGLAVRLIQHHRRSGQSAAVRTGVRAARASWCVTLDGDGQNDPADIPALFAIAECDPSAPALVGGVRTLRRDTLSKRLASRLANGLRQALLRDGAVDTGCGLKLFRRDVFLELPFFGAQHRFLPALMRLSGQTVVFHPVNHRPRGEGRSKYVNWRRGAVGLVDILGMLWLKTRTPMPPMSTEM